MFSEDARKLNFLIAYPYLKGDALKRLAHHIDDVRFVLDSGAFTAWKAGKPIQLDDYCKFIETMPFKPWRYFTLDMIGDAHGTLKNYETMRARGFTPVPIFTRGEDPSVLDEYFKTSDVVGIGGLVGTLGNKGFVKGIMRLVGTRKVHWLGFTNLDFLKVYRPYMADSSSWEMGARFAQVPLYLGRGKMGKINKPQCLGPAGAKMPSEITDAVARLGFDPDELRNPARWQGGYGIGRLLGAASFVQLSLDMREKLGTHLFMAGTTGYAMDILIEAFRRIEKRNERKTDESSSRVVGRNGLSHGASLGEVQP